MCVHVCVCVCMLCVCVCLTHGLFRRLPCEGLLSLTAASVGWLDGDQLY